MKKDLQALREVDALKERDKIAKIKTLEEQKLEQEKKLQEKERAKAQVEKTDRETVLEKGAAQEREAEKDLKEYATEQEKQQIFQFESERLNFEKQADEIDKEKNPGLKLQKNEVLIQKRNWEAKLNSILEQEKKLEDEQSFIAQKAQQSVIGAEKKSLEQRRWDLDKEIQEVEKKRWGAEKQLENLENKVKEIDRSSDQLVEERNLLKQKILGVDKSLRGIYSVVIAREEEKRRGEATEQKLQKDIAAKSRTEQRERVQRQQWGNSAAREREMGRESLGGISAPAKARILETTKSEEKQREKFIQEVEGSLPVPPKKQ